MSCDARYVVAFWALACISCAPRFEDVFVRPDDDNSLMAIVGDSSAAVNDSMGVAVVHQGKGYRVRWMDTTAWKCAHQNKDEIALARWCFERYGEETIRTLFVHELGHAFGLGHVEDEDSVMFRRVRLGMSLERAAESLVDELAKLPVLLPPNEHNAENNSAAFPLVREGVRCSATGEGD